MKPVEIPLDGEKFWVCSECNNEQSEAVQCKKCGAPAQSFDEVRKPVDYSKKSIYEVKQNVLIQGKAVDKGILVILPDNHYVTKDLLTRKLMVLTKKTSSKNKGIRMLSRKTGDTINPFKKVGTRDASGLAVELK